MTFQTGSKGVLLWDTYFLLPIPQKTPCQFSQPVPFFPAIHNTDWQVQEGVCGLAGSILSCKDTRVVGIYIIDDNASKTSQSQLCPFCLNKGYF